MSQLVAVCSDSGALVASDRRIEVREDGNSHVRSSRKLFAVGSNAAIATSGAAVGIAISRKIAGALNGRPPMPFSELAPYVLGVFIEEYRLFLERGASWFASHPESPTLSYLLLAASDPDGSCRMGFFASENHNETHRPLPTGDVICAPRRLGLEARLKMAAMNKAGLKELKAIAADNLWRIERAEEAVAGPFDFALIGPGGVRLETLERT